MEEFLRGTKDVQALETANKVHVVMGNEACDLDSAACAVVYAYYLHKTRDGDHRKFVPVLNIPSVDFRLRSEACFHLNRAANITSELLTFRDQISLEQLHTESRLSLSLVDHNVLSPSDLDLEDAVVEVIDHHRSEHSENKPKSQTIELVGSCCTLVAEKLINDAQFYIDHQVAELLYGTVILDTFNLSEDGGTMTAKDVDIIDKLTKLRAEGAPPRDQVYADLNKAKIDISGFTTMEMLRKDMKTLSSQDVKVVFSSIRQDVEEFAKRDDVLNSLSSFASQQMASAVIIMSLTLDSEGKPHRQIGVYSERDALRERVSDVLTTSTEPTLELSPLTTLTPTVSAFRQGNFKASRKSVLPQLKAWLDCHPTVVQQPTTVSQDSGLLLESPSGEGASGSKSSIETPSEVPDPFGATEASGISSENPEVWSEPLQPTTEEQVAAALSSGSAELPILKPQSDFVPDSIKPGGLLDLDFFAPKEEENCSESGTLSSLEDYADDAEPKEELPAKSQQELVDLISDALLEDNSQSPVQPSAAAVELLAKRRTGARTTSESSRDLFDGHEGLLMESSPLQGQTPDPGTTPEACSQPTSPPNASYPATPPNSYIDPEGAANAAGNLAGWSGQQDLPSFMSADMVRRIHAKKAAFTDARVGQDGADYGESSTSDGGGGGHSLSESVEHFPFTPQNSVSDSSLAHLTRESILSPFNNAEMVKTIQNKRSGLQPSGSTEVVADTEALKFPFTPPNSFVDSSFAELQQLGAPPELLQEELAAHMSKRPPRSNLDTFEEEDEDMDSLPGHIYPADLSSTLTQNTGDASQGDEDIEQVVNPYSGNVVAYKIAQDMRRREHDAPTDRDKPFNLDSDNVVAHRIAQEMKQQEENAIGLGTPDSGNVVANRIAQEMKKREERKSADVNQQVVDTDSCNVVAQRIAQEMKQREGNPSLSDSDQLVNPDSENVQKTTQGEANMATDSEQYARSDDMNVIAYKIAQEMRERDISHPTASMDAPCIWESNTVRFTGEDEVDVAEQLVQEVLQKAREELISLEGSLQQELAQAEETSHRESLRDVHKESAHQKASATSAFDASSERPTGAAVTANTEEDSSSRTGPTGVSVDSSDMPDVNERIDLQQIKPQQTAPSEQIGQVARESTVTFVLPETSENQRQKLLIPDITGRPHSDSQISDFSDTSYASGDSDLSQTTRDFVSRMRSDTGASMVSGNSDDLVEAAVHMDVARKFVDDVMSAAVDVVKQDEKDAKVSRHVMFLKGVGLL